MDITKQMLIFLLSVLPFAVGTFFPFTSWRAPSFSPPRNYGYRSPRSSPPNNNLIPIQSPILGLRVFVPRELLNLFNVRPPIGQEPNYPRPNPFNPHPNYPHEHRPNGFPQPLTPFYPPNNFSPNNFSPNNFSPNYPPDYSPHHPPFDASSFINFMRALYPDMIYRPDPRYPNVFAIRFPPDHTHLPDSRERPPPSEFDPDQDRFFPGEIPNPTNGNEFLEPPPHNHPPQYNQQPQQNQQPHNHLIIIR